MSILWNHISGSVSLVLPAAGLALLGRFRRSGNEMILIESDAKTMFTGTTVVGKPSDRRPATPVPEPHLADWDMADSVFRELEGCQWIADGPAVTKEEAMSGGKYTFERVFEVPVPVENVVSAELIALVDNWCTPTINGNSMARKGGKVTSFEWDVKEFLKSGENVITFDVENNHGVAYLADDPDWPKWNPYGLKYLIRVEYKK